jgi:hypothetical protein
MPMRNLIKGKNQSSHCVICNQEKGQMHIEFQPISNEQTAERIERAFDLLLDEFLIHWQKTGGIDSK